MSAVGTSEAGACTLQQGPITCVVRAWGDAAEVALALAQAQTAFPAILPHLVAELTLLRTPLPAARPRGEIARAMVESCAPFTDRWITPMAAVAGAVADHLLAALCAGRRLDRAMVNNGGDIAFHLAPGARLRAGVVTRLDAPSLDATIDLHAHHPWRGLATSGRACKGRGGRSFSFGIADAVTVLARTAAQADAAATIIANEVDLPFHPAIIRRPARDIDPDSDLGPRLITWDVLTLGEPEIAEALDAGRRVADALATQGRIGGALLALRGQTATVGQDLMQMEPP